ncbi:MAG: bifunctional tetrahydrofolate synthase/dihydrofolate synthase [Candidatus Accumulibacter sp.]|jgi:dihydrofolate synthase/folylpolyglutamate synthase|nr:bifunctional tetrahydrofolate synthase/dihydrofolate synthase [Accumulibacter sp.]
MHSLARWLEYIESFHPKGRDGIELGLDRAACVRDELKQEKFCPLIVVGGTNGKGSTCAYLEGILSLSGCRVGCFTSPHLLEYNERIRIACRPVDDETLCRAFSRVDAARKAAGNVFLTYFEFGMLAAWEVFAMERLDAVILEVGLGGRLDAVNIYDPDVSVVTGVALDHTGWLGTTRESIAFEKAGIFRTGKPAICADSDPPRSLVGYASDIGADLRLIGRDFGFLDEKTCWTFWWRDTPGTANESLPGRWNGLGYPKLQGRCQLGNASAALMALVSLKNRERLSEAAIRKGISEGELEGRFQVFSGPPVIVFDVAHNPQAASVLAENLKNMGVFEKTFAVIGMLADKDIVGVLMALSGRVDVWLPALLDVPRGVDADTLANFLEAQGRYVGDTFVSPEEAFARAVRLAGENDRIIVFGSFLTVASVMRAMNRFPIFGCTNA